MNTKILLGVMVAGAGATILTLAATRPGNPAATADTAIVSTKPAATEAPASFTQSPDSNPPVTTVAAAQGVTDTHAMESAPAAASKPPPTQKELDALLAPIALYPDQLLQQILMAATYPLEVVEAARWVSRPENQGIVGDQLSAALESQDWDPSVKALTAFPQILKMLDTDLDWMGKLGDAFVSQQTAVMDSVQNLRREAKAADKLNSDTRQRVSVADNQISIEPTNSGVVYVPFIDPDSAYGAWPYPEYPPIYISPPLGYASNPGIYYDLASVSTFYSWSSWDWRSRRINIVDVPRYTYYNGGRGPVGSNVWNHDPRHGDRNHLRDDRPRPNIPDRTDNPQGRDAVRDMRKRGPMPQPGALPNVTPPLPASVTLPAIAPPVQTAPMPDRNRFNDDRAQGYRRQRPPEAPNNENAPDEATQRQQQFRQFQDRSINARPLTNVPQQRPQPAMLQQETPPIQHQAPPPRMALPQVQTAPPPRVAPMPVTAPTPLQQADAPRPIQQPAVTNFRQKGFAPPPGTGPSDGKDPCRQTRGNAC